MEEIEQIKKEITDIKERNVRVEADKAWETSRFRMSSILILTYVVATLVMYILEIQKPFLNSLIPTMGFFLSVQSLPFLKKIWIKRYLERKL